VPLLDALCFSHHAEPADPADPAHPLARLPGVPDGATCRFLGFRFFRGRDGRRRLCGYHLVLVGVGEGMWTHLYRTVQERGARRPSALLERALPGDSSEVLLVWLATRPDAQPCFSNAAEMVSVTVSPTIGT
jgi:hypothetical protein